MKPVDPQTLALIKRKLAALAETQDQREAILAILDCHDVMQAWHSPSGSVLLSLSVNGETQSLLVDQGMALTWFGQPAWDIVRIFGEFNPIIDWSAYEP